MLNFYQEGWDSRRFETFVLDLLNAGLVLDVGTVGSREVKLAQKRAKEGVSQDGVDIIAELQGGYRWGIECKHYRTLDLPTAKRFAEKAETEFKAEHYVLAVACEVTKEVQDYFYEKKHWDLWTSSTLTSLLKTRVLREKAATLVRQHFSPEDAHQLFPTHDRLLQSGETYFAPMRESDRLFHLNTPLIGRSKSLERIERYISDSSKKVLILKARGGEGKSRLLAELEARFSEQHPDKTLRLINPSAVNSKDDTSVAEIDWDRAVIIQEDAHRIDRFHPHVIGQLAKHKQAKLIIATRPQAVDALRNQLLEYGIDASQVESRHLEIPRLTEKEMRELAEAIIGKEDPHNTTTLAKWSERSPLICTIGGELIKRESLQLKEIMESQAFHDTVYRRFEQENLDRCACPEHLRADLSKLLRVIALLSPLEKGDAFLDGLENLFGWRRLHAEECLSYLQAAELLVVNRDGYRIQPDLLSDHLVYSASISGGEPSVLCQEVLQVFESTYWPALLKNLSEAEWRSGAADLTSSLWPIFTQAFKESCFRERADLMKHWTGFAVYQPKRSIDLIDLAISETTAPEDDHDIMRGWDTYTHSLIVRQLPAIIVPVIAHCDELREMALERLWTLSNPAKGGDHGDASKLWEKIGEMIRIKPGWSERRSLQIMDWIDELLQRPEEEWLLSTHHQFFNLALSPVFARKSREFFWEDKNVNTVTYQLLPRATIKLRNRFFRLFDERISLSPIACGNVISLLSMGMKRIVNPSSDIGNHDSETKKKLKTVEKKREQWRSVRQDALAKIEAIVRNHDNPFLHYRAHQEFQHLLDYEEDGRFRAEVLRADGELNRSLDYQLCRCVIGSADSEFMDRDRNGADFNVRYAAATKAFQEFNQSTVIALKDAFPHLSVLEDYILDFTDRAAAFGYTRLNWHAIIRALHQNSAKDTEAIIDHVVATPDSALTPWLTSLLAFLPNARLMPRLGSLFGSSNESLFDAGLSVLERSSQRDFPGDHWRLLLQLAGGGSPKQQKALAAFAVGYFYSNANFALQVIGCLPASALTGYSLKNLASSLSNLQETELKKVPSAVWDKLFEAMVPVGDLSERFEHLLLRLNRLLPKRMYELCRIRIERSIQDMINDVESDYVPLPYRFDYWQFEGLSKDPSFPEIVESLLNRIDSNAEGLYYWQKLFWVAVMKEGREGMNYLTQRLRLASNSDEIMSLISIVSREGSLVVFNHPEFVKQVLARCDRLSTDEASRIRWQLLASVHQDMRGYTNGELDPDHGYLLDAAREAYSKNLEDTRLANFYEEIIAMEVADREHARRQFQED